MTGHRPMWSWPFLAYGDNNGCTVVEMPSGRVCVQAPSWHRGWHSPGVLMVANEVPGGIALSLVDAATGGVLPLHNDPATGADAVADAGHWASCVNGVVRDSAVPGIVDQSPDLLGTEIAGSWLAVGAHDQRHLSPEWRQWRVRLFAHGLFQRSVAHQIPTVRYGISREGHYLYNDNAHTRLSDASGADNDITSTSPPQDFLPSFVAHDGWWLWGVVGAEASHAVARRLGASTGHLINLPHGASSLAVTWGDGQWWAAIADARGRLTVWTPTLGTARTLPITLGTAPVPNPGTPVPNPGTPPEPPTPIPVEPPMSDTLRSSDGRFRLVAQNDGNVVVYGPNGTTKGLAGVWPWDGAPQPQPTPPEPGPAPAPGDFTSWPRRGLSFYASLTDPRLDPVAFFARLRDAGANLTRTWLFDAWAVNQGGAGQYDGFVPFLRDSNGVWDLYRTDPRFFERLRAYVEAANAAGVLPQLTGLELYVWSRRKANLLWVPDQSTLWMQRNRQGLVYRDDDAFDVLATGGTHGWLAVFYQAVVNALVGLHYTIELGNEMPEKPLHERLRGLWRAAGYAGAVQVNRQEDTPGQYANMRIPANYDLIAFHGKRDLNYLDERFEDEPVHKTFRSFYASPHDPSRITLSSDGCRKSTNVDDAYDYDALASVFKDAKERGMGWEHQGSMKLRNFTHGTIDLNDLETEWFRSL